MDKYTNSVNDLYDWAIRLHDDPDLQDQPDTRREYATVALLAVIAERLQALNPLP